MKHKEESKRKRPRWWGTSSVVLLFVVAPGSLIAAYQFYPLTNDVQGAAVGAGVLLNVVCFLSVYLLGRAGLHRYKTRHFVNFGSCGLFVLGLGVIGLFNAACDPNPLEEHEVVVTKVPDGYNQSGEAVEDWRPGHDGGEITLPRLPDGVRPGDRVVVIAGSGLLGSWFEDVRGMDSSKNEGATPLE